MISIMICHTWVCEKILIWWPTVEAQFLFTPILFLSDHFHYPLVLLEMKLKNSPSIGFAPEEFFEFILTQKFSLLVIIAINCLLRCNRIMNLVNGLKVVQ